jgi:hypothetical protein
MKLLPCLLLAASVSAAATACGDLAKLVLPDATITTAQTVPAGAFTPPEGPPIAAVPAFCRVAVVAKPSADSDIRLEVWLPSSNWNGKFQGVGNGGFAGSIGYGAMAVAIGHGYATASTDTGHRPGGTDASWALGHHEKTVDFGYRAIHETAAKAKAIIHAFYGESPKKSYFSSCSNGGRQALMEAQRYPADYDGIIAGAPANYWTHLLTQAVANIQATLGDPASYISAAKLPAIQSAALAACDANDGVKDGVIEDPAQCHFDPSVLLCKAAESDACLTQSQLTTLKKLYAGARNSKGEQIMPGYSPGGEAEAGGWAAWITGPQPGKSLLYAFGTQFYSNMVFDNAAWDWKSFQIDRDVKVADDKMAGILNAADANLKPFQARGGKLILYHGWSDAAIPAQSTIQYYQSVEKKMGAQQAAQFVRLYMVPGMEHCGGGASPNSFGQGGVPMSDAQHDIDAALERWVEQGTAPAEVIASKLKPGAGPANNVVRTRPLCPYPQTAHYKGSGNTDDAANFVCK